MIICSQCKHVKENNKYKMCDTCRKKQREKASKRKYKNPQLVKNEGKLYREKKIKDFPLINALNDARYRALHSNLEFSIDIDFCKKLWENPNCSLCGILCIKNNGCPKNNSPSLDRVNNNKGYTPDNVKLLCYHCNQQKSAWTYDKLLLLLKYIKG